jgi:DNA-binding MarR family transcriptional regulator
VLITLTPSGAELFGRIREDELRALAGLAADCTPEETAAALKVLTALNRDVRRRTA